MSVFPVIVCFVTKTGPSIRNEGFLALWRVGGAAERPVSRQGLGVALSRGERRAQKSTGETGQERGCLYPGHTPTEQH